VRVCGGAKQHSVQAEHSLQWPGQHQPRTATTTTKDSPLP
jgi:hypothetical protein